MCIIDDKHLPKHLPKHLIVDAKKCEALCDCGHKHEIPLVKVVTANDAYDLLAEDCAKAYANQSVLILDDENTHLAAGASITELLEKRAGEFKLVTLSGDTVATDELAEQIYDLSLGHNLIIAVGAGTINDLG